MSKGKKLKSIFILIGVAMVMMAAGYIYGFYKEPVKEQQKEITYNSLKSTSTEEDKGKLAQEELANPVVSIETNIEFTRVYLQCGDSEIEQRRPLKDEIGLEKDEIQNRFPEWQIGEFSKSRVVFTKEIDNYCPHHYIIRENDGFVAICIPGEGEEGIDVLEQTSIKIDILPPDLQGEIRVGIVVDSLEQIEHLMENWES